MSEQTFSAIEITDEPTSDLHAVNKAYIDKNDGSIEEGEPAGPSINVRRSFRSLFVSWDGLDVVVSGRGYYQVQLALDDTYDPLIDDLKTKTSWTVFDGLDQDTTYYIRVRAVDAAGNTTGWTATFTTSEKVVTDDISNEAVTSLKIAGNLQSDNYNGAGSGTPGTQGWFIGRADGFVELGNALVRGTIEATAGTLHDLDISGTLTVDADGMIRTIATSDRRLEIIPGGALRWQSPDGLTNHGSINYGGPGGGGGGDALFIGSNGPDGVQINASSTSISGTLSVLGSGPNTILGGANISAGNVRIEADGSTPSLRIGLDDQARISRRGSRFTFYTQAEGEWEFRTLAGDTALTIAETGKNWPLIYTWGEPRPDLAGRIGLCYGVNGIPQLFVSRNSNPPFALNRNNSNGHIAQFRRDQSVVGSISVTTSSTSYNTSSDRRLKRLDGPVSDALARLRRVPVYRGAFLTEPDDVRDLVVADEVQQVAPYAVSGEPDGEEFQSYDASHLVPLIIAAIQGLDERTAHLS